ncbi:hypothetical protein JSE7799_02154 [Jannaschia seosinensis]|uniref:Endonuclease/exonuclease/phosphatase domain-containing protein n=1 Tax=Jannaschia seosinensis TaxID=313367 RepID=A0A0M7B9G4_9RHOB|nr:endonuclease/exonuclease/phosphatase family protein [Jannaschia seosinensis]CUH39427.1 hypothetical protein JSE7799_02154 [Jannaschia seosinensis]
MIHHLRSGRDDQAEAALAVIAAAEADVILLLDVDWDLDGVGLAALAARLEEMGQSYPYRIALRPNSGTPSGFDLDGNGTDHEARDALGYGWFTGDSGLALLSRLPIGDVRDLSATLWADRPDAANLMPEGAHAVVPLATTAQWVVPIRMGETEITLVTMAAGTPVFDGPEDRNGLRNREELAFVAELVADAAAPLVLGRANLDPERGEGHLEAIRALLEHPKLRDPRPERPGGGLETVAWNGPGHMRVDYVLPPRIAQVAGSGVIWPEDGSALAQAVAEAGSGRLVWVDLSVP